MVPFGSTHPMLHIDAADRPPCAVLHCVGEIDIASVDCLQTALRAAIHSQEPEVEVDLREVTFFDSSAVKALLQARHYLTECGRRLSVRASPRGRQLFRTLRLDQVLTLRDGGDEVER